MSYKNHPAADLFPMMTDAELGELAADIKANGLKGPIILLDGMILDGRNRAKACEIAGKSWHFQTWFTSDPAPGPGSDPWGCYPDPRLNGSPVAYVISKNLHRRHLTESQRALIALEMVPMLAKEAKEREHAGNPGVPGTQGRTAEIAGRALGVSGSTVKRALRVQREAAPEVLKQIKAGKVTVKAAERALPKRQMTASAVRAKRALPKVAATKPEDLCLGLRAEENPNRRGSRADRWASYQPVSEGQRRLAEGQKKRLRDCISSMGTSVECIAYTFDLPMALSVCSEVDIANMLEDLEKVSIVVPRLRAFLKSIKGAQQVAPADLDGIEARGTIN